MNQYGWIDKVFLAGTSNILELSVVAWQLIVLQKYQSNETRLVFFLFFFCMFVMHKVLKWDKHNSFKQVCDANVYLETELKRMCSI